MAKILNASPSVTLNTRVKLGSPDSCLRDAFPLPEKHREYYLLCQAPHERGNIHNPHPEKASPVPFEHIAR